MPPDTEAPAGEGGTLTDDSQLGGYCDHLTDRSPSPRLTKIVTTASSERATLTLAWPVEALARRWAGLSGRASRPANGHGFAACGPPHFAGSTATAPRLRVH
jgi:hypothetical protein